MSAAPIQISCPHCLVTNRIPIDRLKESPRCGKCKNRLFTGKPVDVNEENWQQLVMQSDLPVLVDCWASWCGPCQSFAPVYEEAAKVLEPQYRLLKLDTQNQQSLASKLGIRSIPTLIAFKAGKEITRQSGAMPLTPFLQWVRQLSF